MRDIATIEFLENGSQIIHTKSKIVIPSEARNLSDRPRDFSSQPPKGGFVKFVGAVSTA